jgi:acetyl-CoA carboxylase carboxyltransferase component
MAMKDLADDLGARREKASAMGGAEAIARQHGEGKLTVRERVARLFDPGSFQEIGLLAQPDLEAERARKIEEFRQLINPYIAAGGALIDDVIDPRETRPVLIRALEMAATKKVDRPWKKHGIMPV